MKRKKLLTGLAGLVILCLTLGFSLSGNRDMAIVKNLDIYFAMFKELNMFYVDETDPEELVTTSIKSMLSSLDPYTTYIPESEMDDFAFQTTGEYGGIGSLIRNSEKGVIIAEPYENSPSAKAGLKAGDLILSIGKQKVTELNTQEVSEKLKGSPGTELLLKVERMGADKPLEIKIIRETISIPNVPYYGKVDECTGYIRLSGFTTGAAEEVKEAYGALLSDSSISSLILDLRSNPGGLLIEAVRTCNVFVKKGETIVETRGKVSHWDSEYKTTREPIDTLIPLVVLVNRGSASSSEIVAGALQDLDRAVIVGQRTFGKGLVQATRPLKYNSQLKVTTAKYYIPSGRCIQALDYTHRNEDGSVGAIPDSLVSAYKTRNGRTVYDGGGIQPDFEVEAETLPEIAIQLYTQQMFFDYATLYCSENIDIAEPAEFSLSDEDYRSFGSFLEEKNFDFQNRSEKALQNLIKMAKQEQYYEIAEEELAALELKLGHNNLKDLETFNRGIKQLLEDEILSRYYYQRGRIIGQLQDDPQLDRAIEVFSLETSYHETLQGRDGNLSVNRLAQ